MADAWERASRDLRVALVGPPENDPYTARALGLSLEDVRAARDARDARREATDPRSPAANYAVERRARELAEHWGWEGSCTALVVLVLERVLQRAKMMPARAGVGVLDNRGTRLGSPSPGPGRQEYRPHGEPGTDRSAPSARPRIASSHMGAGRAGK